MAASALYILDMKGKVRRVYQHDEIRESES